MAARYHHGDLRSTMLDLAEEEIEKVGHEALELTSLAAQAGVSKGAPYRHFRSRDDLLMALAERGLAKLSAMNVDAAARPGGTRDRIVAVLRTFVDFAKEQPKLFRLIFASGFVRLHFDPGAPGSVLSATFGVFEKTIGGSKQGASAKEVRAATLAYVASILGFVMMIDFARFDTLLIDGETEESLLLEIVGPHLSSVSE